MFNSYVKLPEGTATTVTTAEIAWNQRFGRAAQEAQGLCDPSDLKLLSKVHLEAEESSGTQVSFKAEGSHQAVTSDIYVCMYVCIYI